MKSLYKSLVYSNVWVSVAVASLTFISLHRFSHIAFEFLLFVFAATGFSYSYMRLVQMRNYRRYKQRGMKSWVLQHPAMVWGYTFFFAALVAYTFYQVYSFRLLWLMALPGAISLLYPITFKNAFSGFTSLRDVPGLKMFLIAVTWSYVTVLVPDAMYAYIGAEAVLEFIMRSLLILGLVIPFDIRDQEYDDVSLRTLPQVIGVDRSRQLAMFLIFLYQLWLALRFFIFEYDLTSVVALMLGFEAGSLLIRYAQPEKRDSYYSFWLEGVPLFAVILLILAQWLF